MRVALIQLGYGDAEPVADRVARAADLVRRQRGHDLVVLPELWAPTGFGYPSWAERAEPVDGPTAQAMSAAARDAGVMLHAGSIVERPATGETGPQGKDLWNTSLVFAPDGRLAAAYRKIHRFGFGAGEPALMEAGERVVLVDLPDPSSSADEGGGGAAGTGGRGTVCAGLSTCYDLRFPELFRLQVDRGAQVLLMCSCWPLARVEHWRLLGRARALENQCLLIACNTAGTHGGAAMGGHSQVVGPDGVVLLEAGLEQEVLSVEVDVSAVARYRAEFPVLADRRPFT